VNTAGGSAPAGGCPAAGTRAFVPYETDYVFYRAVTGEREENDGDFVPNSTLVMELRDCEDITIP
jgi:hypothetical protein